MCHLTIAFLLYEFLNNDLVPLSWYETLRTDSLLKHRLKLLLKKRFRKILRGWYHCHEIYQLLFLGNDSNWWVLAESVFTIKMLVCVLGMSQLFNVFSYEYYHFRLQVKILVAKTCWANMPALCFGISSWLAFSLCTKNKVTKYEDLK